MMPSDDHTTTPTRPTSVAEVRNWKLARPGLACRFDPSGRYVVAGGMNADVTQFDLEAKIDADKRDETQDEESENELPGLHITAGKSWVTSLLFSQDGSRLLVSDYTGQLMAFAFPLQDESQPALWKRPAHKGCLRMMALSPDSRMIATCGNDDAVRVWSVETGKPEAELAGHDSEVYGVVFHPEGDHLVSADVTGVIKHWDLKSGQVVRELDMRLMFKQEGPIRSGGPRSMSFSPSGDLLACGGLGQIKRVNSPQGIATVLLFDWKTGRLQTVLIPQGNTDGFVNGLAFHPDGYIVGMTGGASSRAGLLMFWSLPAESPDDTDTKTEPVELKTFLEFKTATSGWAMDLHPDQSRVVVAHHDKQLRLYELSAEITDETTG